MNALLVIINFSLNMFSIFIDPVSLLWSVAWLVIWSVAYMYIFSLLTFIKFIVAGLADKELKG